MIDIFITSGLPLDDVAKMLGGFDCDRVLVRGAGPVQIWRRSPRGWCQVAPPSPGMARLVAEFVELEHRADDLRLHAAYFADALLRSTAAISAEGEIDALVAACTRVVAWCEANRPGVLQAALPAAPSDSGPTGLGDFSGLADSLATSAGIVWRDIDGLAIAYRAAEPVAAVYRGDGGWYWCDLTSAFAYGGGLLAGPWPNLPSAQAKACGRFFAICDAAPGERRAAMAACPIALPQVVRAEIAGLIGYLTPSGKPVA
ncbi:MAG: hypothetical protein KAY22_07470 [Rhizorhabdus sp.]|uniref:hypothetical protein n=1 Tax=Rhizorhabdus sp. TaxID=1968843 RepID=UPI001B4645AA|nr:hypothetical protein [Rhizorhabdus sp.]MBP8232128.1 hypothetical protein [Rhizorhabdus sp.]